MSELPLNFNAPFEKPLFRPRILLVDDEPLNLRVLQQILYMDYEVFMATSGVQAIPFCEATPPDLVLLDLLMPEMDGVAVCKKLKATPTTSQIPVIFITSSREPMEEIACWDAGGNDFVNWPINPITLGHRIRAQLTLKFHTDHLRQLVYVDALTGVYNRLMLEEKLPLEWRRSRRNSQKLSVIMIDIDFFKRFNDYYGHIAGDDCLRKIAQAIRAVCRRPHDLVVRFGGEEFCCFLPETDAAAALVLAEKILQRISILQLPHAGSLCSEHVTASLGVAEIMPTETVEAETLLELADQQLYRAKIAGRNCIRCTETV